MAHRRLMNDDLFELRLLVEEIVCNLCRFLHVSRDGVASHSIEMREEVPIGDRNLFADLVVRAAGLAPYVVEVKYGQPIERTLESLRQKYGGQVDSLPGVSKLVLVTDRGVSTQADLSASVRKVIPDHWELELWDEERMLDLVRHHFGVNVASFGLEELQEIRHAIDQVKGRHAFGADYTNAPLDASLLWHFAYWRLRTLFETTGKSKRDILRPGAYADVAIVFADLCGFSGYVRDSRDERTIRDCLSLFSSKSRRLILYNGGMLYQFLGDAVIGFFGIPNHSDGEVDRAFECAKALITLGEKVSAEWQSHLDRIQPVHIGVALGQIQILSLRPFSRTYIGAVGDAINVAARLCAEARPGQIVASNLLRRHLSESAAAELREAEPVQAKNVGLIRAWICGEE
jgi:class 3 adenylate cyclase